MRRLMLLWLVATLSGLAFAEATGRNLLFTIDKNRNALIEEIVARHVRSGLTPNGANDLRRKLASLRADRLLIAQFSSSLDGIDRILDESVSNVSAKNLA